MSIDAIKNRRSVRKFREDAVSADLVRQVLEAGRLAPSWKNLQTWEILVVTGSVKRREVANVLEGNPAQKGVSQAPVLLIVCADPEKSGVMGDKQYYMTDTGIIMDHIMLQAADLGLGTVFIGLFDEEKVRVAAGIPEKYRIVALTPLGYPEILPNPRPRKEIDEIVHWENW